MEVNTANMRLISKIRPEKAIAEQFPKGYLFGKPSIDSVFCARQNIREDIRREKREGMHDAWRANSTPLSRYTQPWDYDTADMRPNFEQFLVQQITMAETEDRVLRVLDVGVGGTDGWLRWLNRIEFHATSLTAFGVARGILKHMATCAAAGLWKQYPPDYFDIVVSHYGTHNAEKSGLENMLWVAKPGGYVLVSGEERALPTDCAKDASLYYRIIQTDTLTPSNKQVPLQWFYMLEKKFRSLD